MAINGERVNREIRYKLDTLRSLANFSDLGFGRHPLRHNPETPRRGVFFL
jgi:hypothetical protein